MAGNGILDELELVSVRLAREQDLAPQELRRLIRRRGELTALLVANGLTADSEVRLRDIFRQGAEAQRRMAVYRDSLRQRLTQLQREQRLLGQIRVTLPGARIRLDLQV